MDVQASSSSYKVTQGQMGHGKQHSPLPSAFCMEEAGQEGWGNTVG